MPPGDSAQGDRDLQSQLYSLLVNIDDADLPGELICQIDEGKILNNQYYRRPRLSKIFHNYIKAIAQT